MRKILHVDMDAFFAAIEQRDDPRLRGRPVAVGGGWTRGVVMAASYEARRFGVRSAMPGRLAAQLCPDLVFLPARMDVYRNESRTIRAIFARWTDIIEPLALDEAYLDVTLPKGGQRTAIEIARAIKQQIRDELGLTASAGVSCNKFLAKLASGLDKPDGLRVIRPEAAPALLEPLPVAKLHGIGPTTARRLASAGIHRCGDLARLGEPAVMALLGRSGLHFRNLAQGIDERPVEPNRQRKSVGVERTFATDITDHEALPAELDRLAGHLEERLARSGFAGSTLTLKIRDAGFHTVSRQTTLRPGLKDAAILALAARHLLERAPQFTAVRLLGLTVSHASTSDGQLALDFASSIGDTADDQG